jgi:phenylalanyl-tRNA synthetase beta chain
MRILESWLKEYISFKISPLELAEKLTMIGLEFESVEFMGEKYKGFVVGKVLDVQKHPQADRLTVCRVDVGKESLQIVCGAPNVAAGQKVPVGLVGATVPQNHHGPAGEPFVLKNVKIRGVESSGMICSEYELGLGTDGSGILVLDLAAKVGQPLAQHLGVEDIAYDVEITPNRPDWLSHIGVAREVGVLVKKLPKLPAVRLKEGKTSVRKFLAVDVQDRKNCVRFAVRMIKGVTIGPSPVWLQNRLRNAGLRPRNNVVDITNYVMLECGQPMHAFDYAQLTGGKIVVRQAAPGAAFTTLDGKSHTLPDGAVMVCDSEREVSVAGVMGGANSEISDTTVDVVIESANWYPSSIRKTAKKLGISSDASQRFERGADPNIVLYALDRAAQLVVDLAGGTLLKGAIDVYPKKVKERVIALRPARVNAVLGTELTKQQITKYLELLDMRPVKRDARSVSFKVPTYRVDVVGEIDLIEEVARVHGYDNIPEKTTALIDFSQPMRGDDVRDRLRSILVGQGFQEAITNPMQDEQRSAMAGVEPVRILNPQNVEMSTLRTSLVPGLLDVAARNQNRGNPDLRLFEIGHVFSKDNSDKPKLVNGFLEEARVCILLSGNAWSRQWGLPSRTVDFFDIKGETEGVLAKIVLDKKRLIPYSTSNGLTKHTLAIEIHGTYAGYLGQVKEEVLAKAGVEGDVYVAELDLVALSQEQRRTYSALPRFPKVQRDVALVLDHGVSAESVEQAIRTAGGELLQAVALFDVYEGEGLPAGKRSLAFSLELMSHQKTLTETEIDAAVGQIVRTVEQTFGATLRGARNS